MGHNPAFQFYPGDWFREPGLQRVDLDVRGAWAELLMMMHHENPRGVSEGSISGIARQLRITVPRACHIVEQLDTNRIADVEYFDEESRKFIEETADQYTGHNGDMSPECPDVSLESPYFVTIKNRRMVNEEKTKEYERLKKQRQRSPANVQANVPEMSRPLLHSPSPSPIPELKKPPLIPPGGNGRVAEEVLTWLNDKAGKHFRPSDVNLDLIRCRLKSGILPGQLKAIVTRKCREWKGTEQEKYLRPATLFNKTKCEQYLGELPSLEGDDNGQPMPGM